MIVLCMCQLFLFVCLFLAKLYDKINTHGMAFPNEGTLKAFMSYSNGHAELHRSHICNNFLASLVNKNGQIVGF